MKVAEIKNSRAFSIHNDRSLGIQSYGEGNDFPQRVQKIVGASGTGKSCQKVYADFVYGNGFNEEQAQKLVVNSAGQKLGEVLKSVANDYTMFNGFALHVNYNANFKIVEIRHVPFEHLRFEKVDSETGEFHRVAEHDDWGKEFEAVKKFRKQDIVFYNFYNPRPEVIEREVEEAGGWSFYTGQIFYYSGSGPFTYPVPIFEPVLTDMRSEEALGNVVNRNVANNLLSAGAIVDMNNTDQSEAGLAETQASIAQFQGDMKTGNIMYMQVSKEEEVPKFISFRGQNYDKEFSVTQSYVPDSIGRAFNQPPILRAQNVGANFGADLMVNAYNYYNTKTTGERDTLSECFETIMVHWCEPIPAIGYSIRPLSFSAGKSLLARLGKESVDKIYEIVKDSELGAEVKRSMLRIGYDLSDEELDALIPRMI